MILKRFSRLARLARITRNHILIRSESRYTPHGAARAAGRSVEGVGAAGGEDNPETTLRLL